MPLMAAQQAADDGYILTGWTKRCSIHVWDVWLMKYCPEE